jgi:hypothetical protein
MGGRKMIYSKTTFLNPDRGLVGYRGPGLYCFQRLNGTWDDKVADIKNISEYNQGIIDSTMEGKE